MLMLARLSQLIGRLHPQQHINLDLESLLKPVSHIGMNCTAFAGGYLI